MDEFTPIIKRALEQARRVKASSGVFTEALEAWKEEIDDEIAAAEATEETSGDGE